jgi:O-antigen/teichoic acid export membrane protein
MIARASAVAEQPTEMMWTDVGSGIGIDYGSGSEARGLARQVLATALGQGLPQGLMFLSSVTLASRVDDATFAIWTICMSLLALLTVLDGGLTAAVCWRVAVAGGDSDRSRISPLLTRGLALGAGLGALFTALSWLTGPAVVAAFHLPHRSGQALLSLHLLGALVALTICGNVVNEYLRTHGADKWMGWGSLAGAAAFACTLVLGHSSPRLVFVTLAALALQALTSTIVCIVGAFRHGARLTRRPLARPEWSSLWRFAKGTQIANVTALISLQLDAVIIAVMFGAQAVGRYGLAATIAFAFRTPAFYVLAPIRTRLSMAFGASGLAGSLRTAARIHVMWRWGFALYVVVVGAVCLALITVLRSGSTLPVVLFALLLFGYGSNLYMGVHAAALAATGSSRDVAVIGLVCVFVNLVLSVPLALAIGPAGVVLATVLGQLVAVFLIARRHSRLVLRAHEESS